MSFGAEAVPAPVPIPVPHVEPPEPVVDSAEAEDSARPRRSGWWSKRVLGKG